MVNRTGSGSGDSGVDVGRSFGVRSCTKIIGKNFNIEIGRIVPVIEYIQHGEIGGKVKYQGTIWSAQSEESIPPGESVEIIGSKNLTLIIKKIKKED